MPGGPRPSVLYVLGQDRSGSTILGSVLGAADGAVHVGELRQLWSGGLLGGGVCGCGTPVRECPFWSSVLAAAFPAGPPDPSRVLRWQRAALHIRRLPALLDGRALRSGPGSALARVYERLYAAVAEVAGAGVIVDSSKSPVNGALVANLTAVGISFVHLVRDPRATAYSWMRGKADPGRPPGEMWRMPAWRAGRSWVLANGIAERVARRRPSLLIRYEDFVADPNSAVAAIARMAGLAAPDVLDDGTVELPISHTASGNPVRLESGRVQLREDDAWRTEQRPLHRRLVTAMTLPLLHRYGYPVVVSGRRP